METNGIVMAFNRWMDMRQRRGRATERIAHLVYGPDTVFQEYCFLTPMIQG